MVAVRDPADLRKSFKKAFARNGLESVIGYKPAQFAALSQPQIFKVMDQIEDDVVLDNGARRDLARNVHAGLMFNPDVRNWYAREQAKVVDYTRAAMSDIWDQPREEAEVWLEDGYALALGTFPEFFRIRKALDRGISARMEQHGLMVSSPLRQKRQALALAPAAPEDVDLVMYGPVDKSLEQFRNGVSNAFRELPYFLRRFAIEFNYQFRVGRKLGSIDPQYTEKASWDERHTYEEVSLGMHRGSERTIDMPMGAPRSGRFFRNQLVQTFERVNETRREKIETIGHEIAHGVNHMMGFFCWNSNTLQQAYNQDVANYQTEGDKRDERLLAYFLPAGAGGKHDDVRIAREEAFCEIMIELSQGPKADIAIAPHFPQTAIIVKNVIDFMRCEYGVFGKALDFPDVDRFNAHTARRKALANPQYRKYGAR